MKIMRQPRILKRLQDYRPVLGTMVFVGCMTIALADEMVAAVSNVSKSAMHGVVKVNRTVPKVKPPQKGLELSTNPTVQEISLCRVFQEPLVPIGGEPSADDNAALAKALLGYAKRNGPDDFTSLTDFLEEHPQSPWCAALLTGLGSEYYYTAHYSLALDAWKKALEQANTPTNVDGIVVLARAEEDLALMDARLGRMTELEALLKPFRNRGSEKINEARDALWMMKNQPEISFRCGPLALQSIIRSDKRLLASTPVSGMQALFNSASTTNGFSLSQIAELSKKAGLNYQMAFREQDGAFVVPSVVHWKVGHYAAIVRQVGDRYLVEDPTFGNTVWATKQALQAETSGYFLIPPGELPRGWRTVRIKEGGTIWGKGVTGGNDPDVYTPNDLQTGGSCPVGMPVASIHLMTVNLSVVDTPLAYTPPVGPPVRFTFRYNSRDASTTDRTFGGLYWNGLSNTNVYTDAGDMPERKYFISPYTRMTHDWISYLVDSPQSTMSDVKYFVGGGGVRTFTGFDTNTQTFAPQQFDQTLLKRTGTNSYEMLWPDGSKRVFGQSDGSVGSSRRVYLTQIADPAGNALTFTYDQNFRVTAVTDAIGQVTTVSYGDGTNLPTYLLTRVTDPFGRSATFDYEKRTNSILQGVLQITIFNPDGTTTITYKDTIFSHEYYALTNITDMLGLSSQPHVSAAAGDITSVVTPYGATSFTWGGGGTNNTRFAEINYPDGSRERVEYNQSQGLIPDTDPTELIPIGVRNFNTLYPRNTYYWSRTACATSYGDYSKARIFHWLHTGAGALTSGIVESTKEPLEHRVWYNYPDQNTIGGSAWVGSSDRPTLVGRVLDDGQTQLYRYAYDELARLTNSVDPVGRTFSYVYASNRIDLLEIRQTRAGNDELLFRATYNAQHRPLTVTHASGQTTTNTYNARGQLLTQTNPKGETTSYTYDSDGYLIAVDGALPGTNDTITSTYDSFGRVRTLTDVSGYTLTFDYDAMDRVTRITHPDSTFEQFTYDRLDLATRRDRAGRQTFFEYNNMRQLRKKTDPLGRVTFYDWCHCGQLRSLTDPMGRTTSWLTDVQGRPTAKQYADGSQVQYFYQDAISRLRQVIDEKQQVAQYTYNLDNTLKSVAYFNTDIPTPGVSFTYDPDYERVLSMTDGTGTTVYSYNPITSTPNPGAGSLASVDGPLPDDTITYDYDELDRPIHRAINGVDSAWAFDAAGRLAGVTNALGVFAYAFDGASGRLVSKSMPNGQTETRAYGNAVQDLRLQRITHTAGATPISEFQYGRDIPRGRITTWSQQDGAQSPNVFTFGYDDVDQLLSATITNGGTSINTFAYTYDPDGNRLSEQVGMSNSAPTYNSLNQIRTTTTPAGTRTNEWDAEDRLVAVNVGNQRTEFTYNGQSHLTSIRKLVNGSQVSYRRFVWCGLRICEERNADGMVTKRFFPQGVKVENGPVTGAFYYTRDHLGSIREVTDSSGNVRARYSYDPYGRRTKVAGDLDADFGFAGMFWLSEAGLSLTHFRAYDPDLGRWLSRDPLKNAERRQGPNLYAYVQNEPIGRIDREGLAFTSVDAACLQNPALCAELAGAGVLVGEEAETLEPALANTVEAAAPVVENCALADTLPPALADTAPALAQRAPVLGETAPQLTGPLLPEGDLILNAPDYDLVALFYESPEASWVDEYGEEILGDEAQMLWENLDRSRLYQEAALNNLAKLRLPPGKQQNELIDQILHVAELLRGSDLP